MNVLKLLESVYMSSSLNLKSLGSVVGFLRAKPQTPSLSRDLDGEPEEPSLVLKPGYVPPVITRNQSDIPSLIRSLAQVHGVHPDIAIAFAQIESGLNPDAVSPTGAIGLFQLTTSAISEVSRRFPVDYYEPPNLDLTDPRWNANTGILFIKTIARDYVRVPVDGDYSIVDLTSVYAAYNVGIGNLRKLEAGKYSDPNLRKAVSLQARKLSANGTKGYLASVERILNEYIA